ncbi:MAG TPA: hypothetical protein VFV50_12340, partial [Bdellovibrionales bacterium]|nr:hypothetical protein [Bdellovibrionales bacterium]
MHALPFGILPFCRADALVSTRSTLGWNRTLKGLRIHVFHSHVSLHVVYNEGSFEGYDAFFAAGPHHVHELNHYLPKRGESRFRAFEIGSEKLDGVLQSRQDVRPASSDTVLFAPTWGPSSANASAEGIIEALVEAGYTVYYQPHPLSFNTDRDVVQRVRDKFGAHPRFQLVADNKYALIPFATLVTDWSGIAFEVGLGLGRAVIFFDCPQKVQNPNWRAYLREPGIESTYRTRLGHVASTPAELVSLLSTSHSSGPLVPQLLSEIWSYPGQAAERAHAKLRQLLNERRVGSPWLGEIGRHLARRRQSLIRLRADESEASTRHEPSPTERALSELAAKERLNEADLHQKVFPFQKRFELHSRLYDSYDAGWRALSAQASVWNLVAFAEG